MSLARCCADGESHTHSEGAGGGDELGAIWTPIDSVDVVCVAAQLGNLFATSDVEEADGVVTAGGCEPFSLNARKLGSALDRQLYVHEMLPAFFFWWHGSGESIPCYPFNSAIGRCSPTRNCGRPARSMNCVVATSIPSR